MPLDCRKVAPFLPKTFLAFLRERLFFSLQLLFLATLKKAVFFPHSICSLLCTCLSEVFALHPHKEVRCHPKKE